MSRWNPEEYYADLFDIIGTFKSGWGIAVFGRYKYIWKKGIKTLEVGVGSGKWSAMFALMGAKATLVDNSARMLDKVKENFPQINFEEFIKDDVLKLNKVPNKTYDVVFSDGLVEHFLERQDRQKAIQNLFAKVKDKGYLFYTVPLNSHEKDEHCYASISEMGEEAGEAIGIPLFGMYMTVKQPSGEETGWIVLVGRKGAKIEQGTNIEQW